MNRERRERIESERRARRANMDNNEQRQWHERVAEERIKVENARVVNA